VQQTLAQIESALLTRCISSCRQCTFEFGTLSILLFDCSYDLSRIILVTSTRHTKVRLETDINTEVDTRLHQRHRCYILSDADTLSQVSNYRQQLPWRQSLTSESVPGLVDIDIAVHVHTSNVSSLPWICFSGSRLRTGRRVISSGWCPWAEDI
jgi:hypothetical protein